MQKMVCMRMMPPFFFLRRSKRDLKNQLEEEMRILKHPLKLLRLTFHSLSLSFPLNGSLDYRSEQSI